MGFRQGKVTGAEAPSFHKTILFPQQVGFSGDSQTNIKVTTWKLNEKTVGTDYEVLAPLS